MVSVDIAICIRMFMAFKGIRMFSIFQMVLWLEILLNTQSYVAFICQVVSRSPDPCLEQTNDRKSGAATHLWASMVAKWGWWYRSFGANFWTWPIRWVVLESRSEGIASLEDLHTILATANEKQYHWRSISSRPDTMILSVRKLCLLEICLRSSGCGEMHLQFWMEPTNGN